LVEGKQNMKREIKIPSINGGNEFTVPERCVGDRIKMYKAMSEEPKKMLETDGYKSTMEGAYLSLFVLQHKYPDLTMNNILELTDDKLMELTRIVFDIDESKFPKDFREPKTKK